MKRITYLTTLFLLSSCISKHNAPKSIKIVYCPESSKSNTFQIPKALVPIFKSKDSNGTTYEIIVNSTIKVAGQNIETPQEVPIFSSFTQKIFGTPNTNKTDELINSELSEIIFNKKANLKYPEEPASKNQIYIQYNPKNDEEKINNVYYVNSALTINSLLVKLSKLEYNFYLFNSLNVHKKKKPIKITIKKKDTATNEGILKKKSNVAASIDLKYFQRNTLSIDHSNSGNTLTWRSPSKVKNDEINYSISFTNNDNRVEFFKRQLSNLNSLNLSELSNIDFIRMRRLPKTGIKVTITASKQGYKDITECKELALMFDRNEKIAIWNCYNN